MNLQTKNWLVSESATTGKVLSSGLMGRTSEDPRPRGGGGSGDFGIATMPRVKSDTKYTLWRDFAVGGCAKFQIFRIYDSFWTLHA